jgi:hypothetical protein
MAIPFARLMPMRLTLQSGAVRPLAYTSRAALYDPRLETVFDYTHLDGDYACGDIIVPEGHPLAFNDLGIFAASLDLAEFSKVRMPLEERERGIQIGLSLVVALPPEDELWRHEAAELLLRIVTAPRDRMKSRSTGRSTRPSSIVTDTLGMRFGPSMQQAMRVPSFVISWSTTDPPLPALA